MDILKCSYMKKKKKKKERRRKKKKKKKKKVGFRSRRAIGLSAT